VELVDPAPVLISPDAAPDLSLIFSELLDNAISFSPPYTTVEVGARQTAEGWVVRITDHGVGMSEERMAEENARLTTPERLDLASTDVLGLFVVARLGRRHNIDVRLGATPDGGTTAWVRVPNEHLRSQAPAPQAWATAGPADPPAQAVPFPEQAEEPARTAPVLTLVPSPPELPEAAATPALPQIALPAASGGFDWFARDVETEIRKVLDSRSESAQAPRPGLPAAPVPAAASPLPPAAGAAPGLVRRVPGAQLPYGAVPPPPHSGQVGLTYLDPEAARAMIEDFDAGVLRASDNSATRRGF
jgi:hypothetical protein